MCYELSPKLKTQLGLAMRIIRSGGLVAFPTDTIYGLGANSFNTSSVVRIYEVKRRPRHLAVPLLVADQLQLETVAIQTPVAKLLASKFWPGAMTLIMKKRKCVPDIVTARRPNVAVRIPNDPVPLFLARSLGAPIVGTSANISGKPACKTAWEVQQQLNDDVDLIIDGGECPGGIESTIIDVTGDIPEIVREGAIEKECILKVWNIARYAEKE